MSEYIMRISWQEVADIQDYFSNTGIVIYIQGVYTGYAEFTTIIFKVPEEDLDEFKKFFRMK